MTDSLTKKMISEFFTCCLNELLNMLDNATGKFVSFFNIRSKKLITKTFVCSNSTILLL